jgi:ABC-type iron transport system FetAB ATPase subunit
MEGLCYQGRGPIDLAVEVGECVALSGPSASGKTLMLRAIADLDPHEGRVLLDGVECATVDGPTWRRRVGLLRSESHWWRDTVREHFAIEMPEWLTRLGLEREVLDWPVSRLSSGERQRLAVLRLLGNRPEALLLDEPTANLDPENSERVEALIAEYRRETGAAVLWVTHGTDQAERVAVRRFRLDGGRLLPEGHG